MVLPTLPTCPDGPNDECADHNRGRAHNRASRDTRIPETCEAESDNESKHPPHEEGFASSHEVVVRSQVNMLLKHARIYVVLKL